jgi:hypothetical protein
MGSALFVPHGNGRQRVRMCSGFGITIASLGFKRPSFYRDRRRDDQLSSSWEYSLDGDGMAGLSTLALFGTFSTRSVHLMSTALNKVSPVKFEKLIETGKGPLMKGRGCLGCSLQAVCCSAMPGAPWPAWPEQERPHEVLSIT